MRGLRPLSIYSSKYPRVMVQWWVSARGSGFDRPAPGLFQLDARANNRVRDEGTQHFTGYEAAVRQQQRDGER